MINYKAVLAAIFIWVIVKNTKISANYLRVRRFLIIFASQFGQALLDIAQKDSRSGFLPNCRI